MTRETLVALRVALTALEELVSVDDRGPRVQLVSMATDKKAGAVRNKVKATDNAKAQAALDKIRERDRELLKRLAK